MGKYISEFSSLNIHRYPPAINDPSGYKSIIDEKNKIKYHYTSPEALLSILSNKSLRFTDIRYLNDKSESIYIYKVLFDFMSENKEKYPYCNKLINDIFKENSIQDIRDLNVTEIKIIEKNQYPYNLPRTFVFCTCNECDSLNMWNYYVNNNKYQGYNIGLNIEKLLKTFNTDSETKINGYQVYFGKVIYDKKIQTKEIESMVESIEKFIYKSEMKGINWENTSGHASVQLRRQLDILGSFFKDKRFKSEEEYRIVFKINDSNIPRKKGDAEKYYGSYPKELCEGFCVKQGIIIPYINVPLPRDAVSRITVSPITEFDIAKSSLREVLENNEFKNVGVYQSSIPIRF